MSRFALDWLRKREPADLAARDAELARHFAAALPEPGRPALRIIDLGAGSGGNFRALAPLIAGDQEWALVDNDGLLLAAQAEELAGWARAQGYSAERSEGAVTIDAGGATWRASALSLDLAHGLDRLDGLAPIAVTMAALVDLVSAAWIDELAAWLGRRRLPFLSVLGADGRRHWSPPAREDAIVREGFLRHQAGDKGFGPALGGSAPAYLAARLAARGFRTATAPSDWRLGPAQRALLADLVAGEAEAARAARPAVGAAIAAWERRRREELAAGTLSLVVGHRDVLALPAET
jgi:hypothetical protein